MFSITGTVQNVFLQPGGQGKDGNSFPETTKIQIQGLIAMKNGETKLDLVTMTIPETSPLRSTAREAIGSEITLPVGVYASGGQIRPFIL